MTGGIRFSNSTQGVLDRHCERREAIQLWRRKLESWIASSQVLLAMTTRCESAISRPDAPEVCQKFPYPRSEGAGNTGCALHPRSRVQKCTKKRTRAYRFSGGNPAFPAQWFTAYTCSPRRPGFFATVAGGIASTDLTPASGRQDHTTSPSASSALVRSTIRVHRIPSRGRDDRVSPLCGTGRRII
jgi:hypothetical protein